MEVLISNRQKKVRLNLKQIRLLAEEILRFEGVPENAELSLMFCDDDEMQKLNHQYLGKNRPTDVLSFPLDEDDFTSDVRLLGDVVIDVETATRQAEKLGHSIGLELAFLLTHGILHLLRYDHMTKPELNRMKEREETICRHLSDKKLLKGLGATGGKGPLIKRSAAPTRKPDAH